MFVNLSIFSCLFWTKFHFRLYTKLNSMGLIVINESRGVLKVQNIPQGNPREVAKGTFVAMQMIERMDKTIEGVRTTIVQIQENERNIEDFKDKFGSVMNQLAEKLAGSFSGNPLKYPFPPQTTIRQVL